MRMTPTLGPDPTPFPVPHLDLTLPWRPEGGLVDWHDDHLVVAGQHETVEPCHEQLGLVY